MVSARIALTWASRLCLSSASDELYIVSMMCEVEVYLRLRDKEWEVPNVSYKSRLVMMAVEYSTKV